MSKEAHRRLLFAEYFSLCKQDVQTDRVLQIVEHRGLASWREGGVGVVEEG